MSVHAAQILKPYQKASIVLCCAHRWEAKPFLEREALQAVAGEFPFPLYAGDDDLALAVTGMGATRSAAAVGALLSRIEPEVVANFGVAGARSKDWALRQWIVVNKVTDSVSGRSYFPDRLVAAPGKEGACLTVPRPATLDTAGPDGAVYDMEASGFFTAAEMFLPTSRVAVGKFVSDHLGSEQPRWGEIAAGLEPSYGEAAGEFLDWLRVQARALSEDPRRTVSEVAGWWVEAALGELEGVHLTVSQKRELSARLRAFALACKDAKVRREKLSVLKDVVCSMKGETKSDQARIHSRLLRELHTPPLFSPLR